jgi:hypothetical protein
MNNPLMADEKLKQSLQDILKVKGEPVKRKRQVKKLKQREDFIDFINQYKYANDRTLVLKNDFRVDFVEYEEPFVKGIEALLRVHFSKDQVALIEWWLYDKWQLDGGVLELQNDETGEEIPTDTAEELWELLQQIK